MGSLILILIGFGIGRNWDKIKEFIGELMESLEEDMKD